MGIENHSSRISGERLFRKCINDFNAISFHFLIFPLIE